MKEDRKEQGRKGRTRKEDSEEQGRKTVKNKEERQ